MELSALIEILKEAGDLGNIAVIGFILYFLYEKGIIKFGKKGEEPTTPAGLEDAPPWAASFIEYVNHEQTDVIREQGRQITLMAKSMEELGASMREHTRLDEKIANKLDEWDKFGVPARGSGTMKTS